MKNSWQILTNGVNHGDWLQEKKKSFDYFYSFVYIKYFY